MTYKDTYTDEECCSLAGKEQGTFFFENSHNDRSFEAYGIFRIRRRHHFSYIEDESLFPGILRHCTLTSLYSESNTQGVAE